jgi:hypothetical protein
VHASGAVDVAVRRTVELNHIGFERMRAELFDIDGDRCCQALWAQNVEPRGPELWPEVGDGVTG